MDNPAMSPPPPSYDATVTETYPTAPAGPETYPTEAPPKYEPPKEGPYAQPPPPTGYYPPNPGYPPQGIPVQAQPGYGATVHQTVIVSSARFTQNPQNMDCPNCHAVITTTTEHVTGGLTWLSAGLICLFGCWMGCCLIPFCVPELQDVRHQCPNCARHLGTYHRM